MPSFICSINNFTSKVILIFKLHFLSFSFFYFLQQEVTFKFIKEQNSKLYLCLLAKASRNLPSWPFDYPHIEKCFHLAVQFRMKWIASMLIWRHRLKILSLWDFIPHRRQERLDISPALPFPERRVWKHSYILRIR